MKVAVLTTVHPPTDTRIFHKQVVSLVKAGYQVTYFARYIPGVEADLRQRGIRYEPLYNPSKRIGRLLAWFQLIQRLRIGNYDIWHFHDPELLPLLVLARSAFAPHVRLIYDVHEDVPSQIKLKLYIPTWLRWPTAVIADSIEHWGMPRCDRVITVTDAIQRRCNTFTSNTLIVRNYPIIEESIPPHKLPVAERILRVIYTGGMTEARGIREIVRAMDLLHDLPIDLYLLGLFFPATFEAEICENSGTNVHIVSQVPFVQVHGYLEQSDIGIVCFHPSPNHVEAMPNKLFEYMEAGLPVIASEFPLWREIIEGVGCGLLVDPCNPQAIADAIRQLATDPELRARMGQAGAAAVRERYSWRSEEQTLLNMYAELAAQLSEV